MRTRKRPNRDEVYQSTIENRQQEKENKRWLKSKPRVFVIGGGFTGLLTSVILNAKAIKAGVVEKEKQLANSWITFDKNISQDGFFHFDSFEGISLHSKSLLSRVLKEVGIFNKLEIIHLKYSAFVQNKLQSFHLNNNSKQLLTSLKKKYPQMELRLNDLFTLLKKGFEDNFYFFEVLKKYPSAKAFLEHYTVNDKGLMLNFDWMWMEFGLPLSELDPFTFAIFLADYIIGGLNYLEAGSYTLVKVLSRYIQSNSKDKNLILKSSTINSITISDDYVTKIVTPSKSIKARKYILSAPLYDSFNYLISDQSESYKNYLATIDKLKFKNYKVVVCVGLVKNYRTIGLTNEITILNEESLNDDQAYHAALNNDYEHIPLKIINHGILYKNHSNKTCSLNVIFVDNFQKYEFFSEKELDAIRIKIQDKITKRLINYWKKIKGHIYFIRVYLHQDQAELTGNSMNGSFGLSSIGYNPWVDHSFATPYKNLLVASQTGLPGLNYWFSVYSALRASNAVEVKIKKRQMYSLIDSLSGSDILKLLSYIYMPINDKWQSIQIGWFFDNIYSIQMSLGEDKVTLKAVTYEEASRLPFFIYTTTNALKKVVKGQSGILRQVFSNNMRCKGGAFKFRRLMRECFPKFQDLERFFREFLSTKESLKKNSLKLNPKQEETKIPHLEKETDKNNLNFKNNKSNNFVSQKEKSSLPKKIKKDVVNKNTKTTKNKSKKSQKQSIKLA